MHPDREQPQHTPRQNRLLRALTKDYERVVAELELVYWDAGRVLYQSGHDPGYAYFPTTAIVSLLSKMENGAFAEIAITGNDGVVGVALFMGGATTTTDAIVQTAGHAYQLSGDVLRKEFARGGELNLLLLRYAQALFTQMAQTAACNRHHSLEQQLCRWLLLRLDLLASNEVTATHDLIASLLGVRRSGVSEVARHLRDVGLISYTRGCITVLDRQKLEQCACECYSVVKSEVNRLFPSAT
jgi:CRP-like cAMP-binding protein